MISPSLGYLLDSRDSQIKPRHGTWFFTNVLANRVVSGEDRNYYRLTSDVRLFRPLNPYSVMALWSRLDYQFGQYPEYIKFGLGGQNNLRGYEPGTFRGAHIWNQTAEMRITPWAKRFYRLPIAGLSDFLVSLVLFVDTGIVWDRQSEFTLKNFHAGYGWGLRLFSPFQDVARVDVGYNQRGRVRIYFTTGVRF
jgi:outer membrane protein assembly factor BamA